MGVTEFNRNLYLCPFKNLKFLQKLVKKKPDFQELS